MPAARIFALARTIRCASAGGVVRQARAISSVVSPQTSRSVNAIRASAGNAGWQHVNIRRNRSSSSSSPCHGASASRESAWQGLASIPPDTGRRCQSWLGKRRRRLACQSSSNADSGASTAMTPAARGKNGSNATSVNAASGTRPNHATMPLGAPAAVVLASNEHTSRHRPTNRNSNARRALGGRCHSWRWCRFIARQSAVSAEYASSAERSITRSPSRGQPHPAEPAQWLVATARRDGEPRSTIRRKAAPDRAS